LSGVSDIICPGESETRRYRVPGEEEVRASPRTLRRVRERALQALFQIESTGDDWRESLELFWRDRPSSQVVRKHATALVTGTLQNMERLDAVISEVADKWALERMGAVERNVLRLASQEILFMPEVPPKVTINEAVEVAKKFGTEDSGRFVNGVLDTIREKFESNEIDVQQADQAQEQGPDTQA